MAVTVTNIFDVSAVRKNGRINKLTREALVEGLTSTDAGAYVAEIFAAGVLPSGSITVDGDALTLVSESVKVNSRNALGDATVTLNYERPGASDVGGDPPDTSAPPVIRGGTSLKQVSTGYDGNGDPIEVTHTWPALTPEEEKAASPEEIARAGGEQTERGTIEVLVPMSHLEFVFDRATSAPGAFTKSYGGHVNSSSWQGGVARTWMCTQADFELVDDSVNPHVYRMTFAFDFDPEGWDNDTTALFIDPLTGRPPKGLVDGEGIKTITYYPERDFNTDF